VGLKFCVLSKCFSDRIKYTLGKFILAYNLKSVVELLAGASLKLY
jgi:hypothetical protein